MVKLVSRYAGRGWKTVKNSTFTYCYLNSEFDFHSRFKLKSYDLPKPFKLYRMVAELNNYNHFASPLDGTRGLLLARLGRFKGPII